MPDHCHFLLTIPGGGSISKVMNVYKRAVTFNLGMKDVWQPRFHMRLIDDPLSALHYIHENPVKKNLCFLSQEYPWSSASGKWDVAEFGCL
jgi:REP element-mobilizing transposase RayT